MADDDDDDAFTKKFNEMFHKAMGEREGRFEKKIMKNFDSLLGTKFDELRTAMTDTDDDDDDDDEDRAPAGAPAAVNNNNGLSPEIRAELRQARSEAKSAKEASDKFAKMYEDERTQRATAEERAELVTHLKDHVRPKLLDVAVKQLHGTSVTRDPETQKILWKGDDGETLPLKDGVAQWAKSDLGREFAPPVPVNGRGGRGAEGNGHVTTTPGKMTIEQVGDIVTGSILGR